MIRRIFIKPIPAAAVMLTVLFGLLNTAGFAVAASAENLPPTQANTVTLLLAQADQEDQEPETGKRKIRRLGIDTTDEFELDLSIPEMQQPAVQTPEVRLPDPAQDADLQELLVRLAYDPGDSDAQTALNNLVVGVMQQARTAIDANDLGLARRLTGAVATIRPDTPGLGDLQDQIRQRDQARQLLTDAQLAIDERRFLQPEEDNAMAYLNAALVINPDDQEAQDMLQVIQTSLVEDALTLAQEQQDFESADIILGQAETVIENSSAIEAARTEIGKLMMAQAQDLGDQVRQDIEQGSFDAAESKLNQMVAFGAEPDLVDPLRLSLADARIYGGFEPGQIIIDSFINGLETGPPVVVMPSGSYLMGSPEDERFRVKNEGPQRRVIFERGFALGEKELSVAEFSLFVDSTGYRTDAERLGNSRVYDESSGLLTRRDGVTWQQNYQGLVGSDELPVIHVSWNDAINYLQWLSLQTERIYRLPSESEFEYSLRAGSQTMYWWGEGTPDIVLTNTTGDRDVSDSRRRWNSAFRKYDDGFWGPATVGSFQPNPFGLFDMAGNVSEWVEDCWHSTYAQAPDDPSAWVNPGCKTRVIRGGSWSSSPDQARSAFRLAASPETRASRVGFRVARDL